MSNVSGLKLRHLEIFVQVARHQSVSHAARALRLSQPAVSRALRELEAICGKPLVEAEGRGIRLSAFGAIFLDHALQSVSSAHAAVQALGDIKDDGPPLRLGALPTVAATLAPRAVAQFRETGLTCRLKVVTGENQVLLDQLRMGHLDLVIGRLPAPENMLGLSFDPLFKERVVAVVSFTHPLASVRQIMADDLRRYPMLLPSQGSIIRPLVERLFYEQGFALDSRAIETVSDAFGRAYTRDHNAIWFISEGVVSADLKAGHFVKLPLDTSNTQGPVGLCLRADQRGFPALNRFAQIVRETAQKHGEDR
ncbi:UNVERIFIED_CONTAM: hypothetical protein GTU68_049148 [Idotea baltica]|nr:hypothetical protein [Idotea baltica]